MFSYGPINRQKREGVGIRVFIDYKSICFDKKRKCMLKRDALLLVRKKNYGAYATQFADNIIYCTQNKDFRCVAHCGKERASSPISGYRVENYITNKKYIHFDFLSSPLSSI
eukprot:GEMP01096702.1.p1 GENE.GEMP01096702.1~~GEMP01096702.1.p1  ORF type:complete len:112 (-),score=1.20 GEMP01096702.1:161-496(-)